MAQWLRRLPTEQEIPGSSPGVFIFLHAFRRKAWSGLKKQVFTLGMPHVTLYLINKLSRRIRRIKHTPYYTCLPCFLLKEVYIQICGFYFTFSTLQSMNSVTYLKNHFVEQILVLKKLVEGKLTQQLGSSKKPTMLTLRSMICPLVYRRQKPG